MDNRSFDEYAEKYDEWFLKNKSVLASELALIAHSLKQPGRTLSIGCGSGLFEMLLKKEYNITIQEGIEPSESMADIAKKRGMSVRIGTAEDTIFGDQEFDTILFNGTPSYITDLEKAFTHAYNALKSGGYIVVADVPKESSYAMLYNLAKTTGSWDHDMLINIRPEFSYPIEFVVSANWRTTPEKIELVKKVGFQNLEFAQTLTTHPLYSNDRSEQPSSGYDRGDYVTIRAVKP